MLIKLDNPPSTPISKPRLHTLKNHDDYNGLLHLPQTTHVRVDHQDGPETLNRRQRRRYLITLRYPHHRACTISRSHADVLTLTQRLAAATAAAPCQQSGGITAILQNYGPEGEDETAAATLSRQLVEGNADGDRDRGRNGGDNNNNNNNNNDDDDGNNSSDPTQHLLAVPCSSSSSCPNSCSCSCSCPYPHPPPSASARPSSDDARAAAGALNSLLTEALRRVAEDRGDVAVRVAVEWFLRRRMGDCDGT